MIPFLGNGPKKLYKTLNTFLISEDVDILMREGEDVTRMNDWAELIGDVLEVERVVLLDSGRCNVYAQLVVLTRTDDAMRTHLINYNDWLKFAWKTNQNGARGWRLRR